MSNAVREVYYTIYYEPVGGLYSIEEVEYDLVIQDSVTFTESCSASGIIANEPALIKI